jgi:hypothetical protein
MGIKVKVVQIEGLGSKMLGSNRRRIARLMVLNLKL